MSKINDGGPAYPRSTGPFDNWNSGMTVRQVYAKEAMKALIGLESDASQYGIAHDAFAQADAMLAFEANESK